MNNDTTGALFTLLLAGIGVAVLAYVLMPTAAGALECQERPGDSRTYWSYRIIDGERCWYRGHRRIAKSRLHWPPEPPAKKIKTDPIFNKTRAEAVAPEAMAQADPTPFIFLSDKFQGWAMWFSNRVGEVFK